MSETGNKGARGEEETALGKVARLLATQLPDRIRSGTLNKSERMCLEDCRNKARSAAVIYGSVSGGLMYAALNGFKSKTFTLASAMRIPVILFAGFSGAGAGIASHSQECMISFSSLPDSELAKEARTILRESAPNSKFTAVVLQRAKELEERSKHKTSSAGLGSSLPSVSSRKSEWLNQEVKANTELNSVAEVKDLSTEQINENEIGVQFESVMVGDKSQSSEPTPSGSVVNESPDEPSVTEVQPSVLDSFFSEPDKDAEDGKQSRGKSSHVQNEPEPALGTRWDDYDRVTAWSKPSGSQKSKTWEEIRAEHQRNRGI